MIRQARGVTIPADRSKFDGAGLFRIAPLSDIDRIVADAPPPEAAAERILAHGVEVILVGEAVP